MSKYKILPRLDLVTFLPGAIIGFNTLSGIIAKDEICHFCGCEYTVLPLEELIAVGFGNASLTKIRIPS